MSEAQADYMYLRQAVLLFLKDTAKQPMTPERRLLLDAFAAKEWKRVEEPRRLWALGDACGKSVSFPMARDLATKGWRELPEDVRDIMGARVLDWGDPK